jgi:hypothetical protein
MKIADVPTLKTGKEIDCYGRKEDPYGCSATGIQ